jgi:hypothetical protein
MVTPTAYKSMPIKASSHVLTVQTQLSGFLLISPAKATEIPEVTAFSSPMPLLVIFLLLLKFLFYLFILTVLGFELKASQLLGRHSIT